MITGRRLLGLAVLAAPAIRPGAAEALIELKLGHVLSEQSSYHIAATKLARLVDGHSGGRVRIAVFANSALGGELRLIQSARNGAVDLMFNSQPSLENTLRDYGVLSLPWLWDSHEQANRVLQGPVGRRLLHPLDGIGLIGLSWFNLFERSVLTNRRFSTPAEARGLRIRVIQSPGYVESYRAIGMVPTPTAYADLLRALQTGRVDAAELAPDQVIADRFVEAVRYYVLTRTHQLPAVLIASRSRFNTLPEEVQEIIRASVPEAITMGLTYYQRFREDSFAELRRRGIEIIEPDVGAFKAAAHLAYDNILNSAPNGRQVLAEIEAAKAAG
ncbi:TRAP transporter substrate-binding protein [Rhodovarius crocodyli]|uniref:TRAP transporter substrate-binding protein n=1 Tax=Rhodovarius crocodyli TaxID=1979269 RepID=A0A437MP05_9PROT|nr:TRAP transporter substrate-binding protein [Rhodovarius crocodyli]RVT99373.1 TRAP transporter substrate-binding protein [Rhodovarius crocodyli]